MSNVSVKELVRKVAAILPQLEERGPVYLFALGEREGLNRWEVILSSKWSDRGYAMSVFVVGKELAKALHQDEFKELASISIIPSTEPNITDLPNDLEGALPSEAKVLDLTLMGLEVRRPYIFKARRPSASELTTASAL